MSKRIVLMSGIPGSGKTHHINSKLMKQRWETVRVCSTDHYFMKGGVYQYDPFHLSEAHGQCLLGFTDALLASPASHDDLLIVDNTNIDPIEMAPYVALGNAMNVPITLVTILCDPVKAHRRNQHGVPAFTIHRMADALGKRVLPRHWCLTQKEIGNSFPG